MFRVRLALLAAMLCLPSAARAQTSPVRLAWNPSPDPQVVGYLLDYGTTPGTYLYSIDVGARTDWTFHANVGVPSYSFAVRAYNGSGLLSSRTNEVVYSPATGTIVSMQVFGRHAMTGEVMSYSLDGLGLANGEAIGTPAIQAWRIAGSGDFNGDGRRDLVWQHADGWVAVWLLDNTTVLASRLLQPDRVADTNWRLAAVADLDRDGKSDLIWQHLGNGRLAAWYMNGTVQRSARTLSPFVVGDTDWRIVGAADFDDDAAIDIVWRHRVTGKLAVWYMSGDVRIWGDGLYPHVTDTNWTVAAIADVTGDRRPDILWQHTDGRLGLWLRDSLGLIPGAATSPQASADPFWRVVAVR